MSKLSQPEQPSISWVLGLISLTLQSPLTPYTEIVEERKIDKERFQVTEDRNWRGIYRAVFGRAVEHHYILEDDRRPHHCRLPKLKLR